MEVEEKEIADGGGEDGGWRLGRKEGLFLGSIIVWGR